MLFFIIGICGIVCISPIIADDSISEVTTFSSFLFDDWFDHPKIENVTVDDYPTKYEGSTKVSNRYLYSFDIYRPENDDDNKEITITVNFLDSNGKFIDRGSADISYVRGSGHWSGEITPFSHGNEVKKVNFVIYDYGNENPIYNDTVDIKFHDVETIQKDTTTTSSTPGSSSSSSSNSNVFVKNVLEMYDINTDGKISASEWSDWCAREGSAPISDCDTNGDGYCSQSELASYSHDFGY